MDAACRKPPKADVSMKDNFPGGEHEIITCFIHVRPKPRKSTTNNRAVRVYYKLVIWTGLTDALRSPGWSDSNLSFGFQEAAEILYANLHSIINNLASRAAKPQPVWMRKFCKYERKTVKL